MSVDILLASFCSDRRVEYEKCEDRKNLCNINFSPSAWVPKNINISTYVCAGRPQMSMIYAALNRAVHDFRFINLLPTNLQMSLLIAALTPD